jgi:hypothetical protein
VLQGVTPVHLKELLGSVTRISQDALADCAEGLLKDILADSSLLNDAAVARAFEPPTGSVTIPLAILAEVEHAKFFLAFVGFYRNVLQHNLLLLNLLLWEWMDDIINVWSMKVGHWSNRLRIRVQELVENPGQVTALYARDFVPQLSSSDIAYHDSFYTDRRRHFDISTSSEQMKAVNEFLERVIIRWFNFPSDTNSRCQAYFVREIVDGVGFDGLLLDPIWKISEAVSFSLFRNTPRYPKQIHIREWAARELARHPIALQGSEAHQLLQSIGVQFRRVFPAAATRLPSIASRTNTYLGMTSIPSPGIPLSISAHPEAMDCFVVQISLLFPLLDVDESSDLAVREGLSGDRERRANNVIQFLSHVRSHADRLLPFRDSAPSRRRILEPGGPFGQEFLRTRAGLFSATIYRCVTHHTNFLFEQQRVFDGLTEWAKLYDRLSKTKPPTYFCNKNAYGGQYTASQDVRYIPAFWTAAQDTSSSEWLTADEPIQFENLYQIFLSATISGNKAFPGFGRLKAFLLASDYAIAGLATTPSPESVGKLIFQINAGALKGLTGLGFSCTDASTTSQAFTAVYLFLSSRIPAMRLEQIGYGVFLVEYALCKTPRLDSRLFRTVYKDIRGN